MYAIISIGGAQQKIEKGAEFIVNSLDKKEGSNLKIKDVLFAKKGNKFYVGTPLVKGGVVECEVVSHLRGEKVISFKFKRRKSYKRKIGHRQDLTKLKVKEIALAD